MGGGGRLSSPDRAQQNCSDAMERRIDRLSRACFDSVGYDMQKYHLRATVLIAPTRALTFGTSRT